MPLLGVKPVIAPSRGCANHQFTGGHDFLEKCIIFLYNVFIKNEFAREYDYGI